MTKIVSIEGAPFGTFAPSRLSNAFRNFAHHLPHNYLGRKTASVLLGPAGGRNPLPKDVVIFGKMRARLHPHDNICEKRVYLTPHHWDPIERAALANQIASTTTSKERPFIFFDIGANAGLYTLFALDVARRRNQPFKAICVEPDPTMLARLHFNIASSNARSEVGIVNAAVSDNDGNVGFSSAPKSRGMNQIDPTGSMHVPSLRLSSIVREQNIDQIDAMKMDIEGHEYEATSAMLKEIARETWPTFIILETSHESTEKSASTLFLEAGYILKLQTKLNAVLVKGDA